MKTSPFGARWSASGGQSFMQCGCSQWRQEVGTWTSAKVGPASRSSREVPAWVSAGLFAVVAAHAQRFVDEQDVGRLPGALGEQEADEVAAARHREHRQVGRGALLVFLLQAHLEDRVARDQ